MRTRRCFGNRGIGSPRYFKTVKEFEESRKNKERAMQKLDSKMKEELADAVLMGLFSGTMYKHDVVRLTLDQVMDITRNQDRHLRLLIQGLGETSGIEMLFGYSDIIRENIPITQEAMNRFIPYFTDYVKRKGERTYARYMDLDPELREIM